MSKDRVFPFIMLVVLGLIFASIWIGVTQLNPDAFSSSANQPLLANRAIAIIVGVAIFVGVALTVILGFTLFYYMRHLSRRAQTLQRIAVYQEVKHELWFAEQLLRRNARQPRMQPALTTVDRLPEKILIVDFSQNMKRR